MRDVDLFQLALGLEEPWQVVRTEFDAAARRLDIHLDFPRGSRFRCPECGRSDCPAYDTTKKEWRHLNFFQHEAFLHAAVQGDRLVVFSVTDNLLKGAAGGSIQWANRLLGIPESLGLAAPAAGWL